MFPKKQILRSISKGVFIPLCIIPACGQTPPRPQITQQAKTATCGVNVVVNGGVATFTCTGLTPEQAKTLNNFPTLITKVLNQEKQDSAEILAKLNDCLEQMAGRTVPADKRKDLVQMLAISRTGPDVIWIVAPNHTPESRQYAEQLQSVFVDAGWKPDPVLYNAIGGMREGGVDQIGLVAIVRDDHCAVAVTLANAFKDVGISLEFQPNSNFTPYEARLIVGQKR